MVMMMWFHVIKGFKILESLPLWSRKYIIQGMFRNKWQDLIEAESACGDVYGCYGVLTNNFHIRQP